MRVESLVKVYKEVMALDGLNLEVKPGQVYGFLGPNGAGKSTTILSTLGLIFPQEVRIGLFGEEVFQNGKFNEDRLVEAKKRIGELLDLVGLKDARNIKAGKFSKDMRQRLLLAQALINDPELLILDEPMTGLDPTGIARFKDIIREQRKAGKTVFFSSHILAHVEEVCDTVGVIVKGKLRVEDSIDNIKGKFLRKAGYTIIIETNRPVDWSSVECDSTR